MKLRNIPVITFLLGIALFVMASIVPYDYFEFILGEGLRPVGLVIIFINPIIGVIGTVISLFTRRWGFLILNLLLVFNFFIVMSIGTLILGP